jgi:phosphoglycerate-specific signal transduction histidine kinase
VRRELAVAGAELHLTNAALEQNLPPQAKQGDVRKALDQSGAIEEKVNEAAEELAEVTVLLEEEIEQRQHLEAELARRS